MGKGYNNYMCKKPFHPGSKANIKRAWMAEQKTQNEKQKQEDLKVQYEKEQDLYNNRALLSTESKDKLELNFMYEAPPGAKRERQKEDDEPEFKFEWQRKYNAPRESYARNNEDIKDQPFGIPVRNVRCIKCHKWGHINTDKECPLFSQASTSSMPTTSMDPMELMRQMREDGLGLKENVLGHQLNPMAANQQFIPSDESDPEMDFLKSLSVIDKKKLLRKLKKLSKKQEKSSNCKKKKSKKSERDKTKSKDKANADHSRKKKKNKKSSVNSSSELSSDSISSDEKKKKHSKKKSSKKSKKHYESSSDSDSESEGEIRKTKHSRHKAKDSTEKVEVDKRNWKSQNKNERLDADSETDSYRNSYKNSKSVKSSKPVSKDKSESSFSETGCRKGKESIKRPKCLPDKDGYSKRDVSESKNNPKTASRKPASLSERSSSSEGEQNEVFIRRDSKGLTRKEDKDSNQTVKKECLKSSSRKENTDHRNLPGDGENTDIQSRSKTNKLSQKESSMEQEATKEYDSHKECEKSYKLESEQSSKPNDPFFVENRSCEHQLKRKADKLKSDPECKKLKVSTSSLKDSKCNSPTHPDGFSHLCPQARVEGNYVAATEEYQGGEHDIFRHHHRERRSPSVKQKYNK